MRFLFFLKFLHIFAILNHFVILGDMKRYILLLICSSFMMIGYAQINELDSIRQKFEKDVEQLRADFEAYEAQARADYALYVESIKVIWGGDSVVDNTKRVWVEYDKDLHSRSVVDFEHGNVEVEVAISEKESQDSSLVNSKLAEAIERMLNSRGSTCPYPSSVETSAPLTDRPILEGLIDFSLFNLDISEEAFENKAKNARPVPPSPTVRGKELALLQQQEDVEVSKDKRKETRQQGKTLAERRIESREKARQKAQGMKGSVNNSILAKRLASQAKKKVSVIKGNDGQTRKVIQVQMALVSDNISKNAALYKDLIAEFSEKFQIEQPLIYAIIEQESAFNPQATSWVPAYGLMQLVPRSGGREAYRYIYKVDKMPEMSYLYNPRNNIELGTAYLRVLMNQFARVEDPHCRRLCVIASYNTGAGNVSRSFIGSTNLGKAFSHINQHNYDGLFRHLITNLPYEETRDYVAKVTKRREKYMKE